ncbi:MAG: PilZ domain-containing protein [Spirochaetales bacterium]|nr:PilZ domain-containing protein [Spirochaetales bacterium]
MIVYLQIIFDQERMDKFFEDLSKGFEKSPFEIALAIILFTGMIVVPVILTIIFSIRSWHKAVKAARSRLETIAEQKQLTVEERQILTKLTKYFSRNKRYLAQIATEPASFNAASRRFLKKKPAQDDSIARIRLKLGIAAKTSGQIIHSTAEIIIGTPVLVHGTGIKTEKGNVAAVDPKGIVIKIKPVFAENSPIMVEVRTRQGCFIISTRVMKTQGSAILAAHTEKVEHLQKRKFYRRKVKIPLTAQVIGRDDEPEGGYITDISAGGARIYVPGLPFQKGAPLQLSFSPDKRNPIKLKARTLREHERDHTISIEFLDISKAAQDRIMRIVLK